MAYHLEDQVQRQVITIYLLKGQVKLIVQKSVQKLAKFKRSHVLKLVFLQPELLVPVCNK